MLFLIFSLGQDRYALDVSGILEMLSVPPLKALPNVPVWIAGLGSDGRGTYPVLDMAQLALGRPSRRVLSTRLALLAYPMPDGSTQRLGVLVESATATLRADANAFENLPIATPESPYLREVMRTPQGMVQRIAINDLLPADVRARLFAESS